MDTIQIGNGRRGCKPDEFALYDPDYCYLICQVCEFSWPLPIGEFHKDPPIQCPTCGERWLYGHYIQHDAQQEELRRIKHLSERHIDVQLYPGQGLTWGEEGYYILTIYPVGFDPNPVPPYTQNIPLADAGLVWFINHNLDEMNIDVKCYDHNSNLIAPSNINYIDKNNILVQFMSSQYGSCVCSVNTGPVDPNAHEYIKIAYLTDPDVLENNQEWDKNMLRTIIEDYRVWKRAHIHIYRVIDAIQDV